MHTSSKMQKCLKRCWPYVFIIAMAIAILFFQIMHHFFISGIDSFFHMSITYDTYSQLKNLNFSYFLSSFGLNHSLRIVNAVYGPLGGYFSGFLLLITGSWIRWEISTMFLVFIIAGISMYQLCRYWKVLPSYSLLISGLYMLSSPIMAMWLNSQYDGVGAAFMPWVLYFGSKILNHDQFKNWKLVILLVILSEIHVFSMLLGGLVILMCLIMSLCMYPNRIKIIKKMGKVLALTLILSFNVWGGILEVLGSNHQHIVPTFSVTNMFQNVWSSIFYDPKFTISQNLVLLGLSTTILIAIIIILYLYFAKHLDFQLNFIMLTFGIMFLWLSSRLFPWPLAQRWFPILDTDLQFPKRFLSVSIVALYLMLGIVLTRLKNHMSNPRFGSLILVIILGMFLLHAWQNTEDKAELMYHQQIASQFNVKQFQRETADVWVNNKVRPEALNDSLKSNQPGRFFRIVNKETPDYLPSNQDIRTDPQYHNLHAYYQYDHQILLNHLPVRVNLKHHVNTVSFRSKSTRPITIPFVKYEHTIVSMNGRLMRHPKLTGVGAIIVRPRAGHNIMTFRYVPARWYTILMLLSLVVWLMFIIHLSILIIQRCKS